MLPMLTYIAIDPSLNCTGICLGSLFKHNSGILIRCRFYLLKTGGKSSVEEKLRAANTFWSSMLPEGIDRKTCRWIVEDNIIYQHMKRTASNIQMRGVILSHSYNVVCHVNNSVWKKILFWRIPRRRPRVKAFVSRFARSILKTHDLNQDMSDAFIMLVWYVRNKLISSRRKTSFSLDGIYHVVP